MTLNSVLALIFRFSPNSIALLAHYVTVVEGRPKMSMNIVSHCIADFEPIFVHSASAVTPCEKVQLTLIGSPLHAFQ